METLGFITTHLPYWFYLGAMGVFDIVIKLPWPSFERVFQGVVVSSISFIVLLIPKSRAERRLRQQERAAHKKHSQKPADSHQTASAMSSIENIFHH